MPEVDLSTVGGPELRALLNTARARGQATASYQILQEMADRREGRSGGAPRIVTLDLGDPMAADEAPLYLSPPPSQSVWDDAPDAPPLKLEGLPHPGRPGFARAAVFAAGIVLGAGAGWGAANLDLSRQAPTVAATPPADFLRTANQSLPVTPAPPSAAAPQQIEVVEAPAPGEAVAAGFREVPLPLPEPEDAAEETVDVAEAPAPPTPEAPKIIVLAKAADSVCAAEPTPADRAICADPGLRRLQRELRAAYGEALDAHEDRDRLRQRQLAWRDARNTVEDPARLADLYAARIRKLHAAAEAAREGR